MRIRNIAQLNAFVAALDQCAGQVWLETPEGDRFNLKSVFSQYVAFGALLAEHGEQLELTCSDPDEEAYFLPFRISGDDPD